MEQTYEELERKLTAAQKENEQLRQKLGAKKFNWRQFIAYLCLIIGLGLVMPASLLIWANRTITNTDQYVSAVGPVIHEPAVQQAIVKSATTSLYANTDIQRSVSNLLPDQAKPLAGPITTQVKNYINSTVTKIVASDQFANLWVNVNRRAQTRFMQIAQNKNTSPTVDVNRIYQFVSAQLADTPLAPLAGKQLPPSVGQITVVTIPALASIPHFVNTLSALRWLLLGLAVLFLLAAVSFAKDRRAMAVWVGVGWMAVTIIGLLIIRVLRGVLIGQIHDSTYAAAASDIWHALLTPYYLQTGILFAIGLVVAVVGWLAGPATLATRVRTASFGLLAGLRHEWFPELESSSLVRFLRQYHFAALWLLFLGTVVALLMLIPLNFTELATVLICSVLVWLILEFFVAPKSPAK